MTKEDLIKDLDLGEYGQDFADDYDLDLVDGSYIDDLISEFADNKTSFSFYYNLGGFFEEHADAVDDVINELGWEGVGKSIYTAASIAKASLIEREIKDHEEDILKYMGYINVSEKYDEREIPDEIVNAIDDVCSSHPQTFRQILDAIDGPEED